MEKPFGEKYDENQMVKNLHVLATQNASEFFNIIHPPSWYYLAPVSLL